MNRRRGGSLAGSPLLIGAVTTLIAVVAVFISYNANNGLPFVPTYDIKVELPEASGLQNANQVRLGGTRVGLITGLNPKENPRTGRLTAVADLKLEKSVEPLPIDTHAIVLSVSTIGLKYLELEKGHSSVPLHAGSTIPLSQTTEPVDIDQLFNMFDEKTRTAIQVNTTNFGDGLAARGVGLNETIHTLKPLVTNAIPVLRNLAAPATGFGELWKALNRRPRRMRRWPTRTRPCGSSRTRSSPPGRTWPKSSKKRPRKAPRRWNSRSTHSKRRPCSWKKAPNSCTC